MKLRSKVLIAVGLTIGSTIIGTAVAVPRIKLVAREIGRSEPKQAANYLFPLYNFSATYTDGQALGIAIGMPKAAAIQAALKAGLTVTPEGWGDMRAGGAGLYEPSALLRMMLRQQHLGFNDASDTRLGMEVTFHADRVVSVSVHYQNTEFP